MNDHEVSAALARIEQKVDDLGGWVEKIDLEVKDVREQQSKWRGGLAMLSIVGTACAAAGAFIASWFHQ